MSRADASLIDQLAAEGLVVSQTQLERWRTRGLLPRAQVIREQFGGSSVAPHDQSTVDAARLLAEVTNRGRSLSIAAVELFECGLELRQETLQDAAGFLISRETKILRNAWRRAESLALPSTSGDDFTAVAELAASLAPRRAKTAVRDEIRLARPHLNQTELKMAVDTATAWRIAATVLPERMSDEQRNLGRHGDTSPMDPLAPMGLLPLPDERILAAATITRSEARVIRDYGQQLWNWEPGHLLSNTLWVVAGRRLNSGDIGNPLDQAQLQALAADLAPSEV